MHQILKELRIENSLTQKDLAVKLGITQDSISLWEKGKRIPDTQYLTKLCEIFNVSADYLLGRTDDLGNIVAMPSAAPVLAENEKTLLRYFRALSPSLQSHALETLRILAGVPAEGDLQKKA